VELEETKTILDQATEHSFVIMDELGRGTSTYDGYAIALAVIEHLVAKRCRTLFTTHYHMLVDDVNKIKGNRLAFYHMTSEYNAQTEDLKFLYKFEPGIAPQSFGIIVAKMAGLKDRVLKNARKMANDFKKNMKV